LCRKVASTFEQYILLCAETCTIYYIKHCTQTFVRIYNSCFRSCSLWTDCARK